MSVVIDPRALEILKSRYWSSKGWKADPSSTPADFAYGKSKGLLFDDVDLTHAQANAQLRKAVDGVTTAQVVDAFVASLSTKRLDWRSALSSWVYGRFIKEHMLVPWETNRPGGMCRVCGEYPNNDHDLSVLSFERHQWGGVRHDQPVYIALDLRQLKKLGAGEPTDEDAALLGRILDAARSIKASGTHADLNRALAPIVGGSATIRRNLLETLARAGVLEDPAHPGFAVRGMDHYDLNQAGAPRRGDIGYPLDWWRGRHGVNTANLKRLFARFL